MRFALLYKSGKPEMNAPQVLRRCRPSESSCRRWRKPECVAWTSSTQDVRARVCGELLTVYFISSTTEFQPRDSVPGCLEESTCLAAQSRDAHRA